MARLEEERGAYLRRMGDLSKYMKELKQWISRDYNKKVGRKGTLWEDRFWSNLLEDSAATLTKVAYYIDSNAVRAGIVKKPATPRPMPDARRRRRRSRAFSAAKSWSGPKPNIVTAGCSAGCQTPQRCDWTQWTRCSSAHWRLEAGALS